MFNKDIQKYLLMQLVIFNIFWYKSCARCYFHCYTKEICILSDTTYLFSICMNECQQFFFTNYHEAHDIR